MLDFRTRALNHYVGHIIPRREKAAGWKVPLQQCPSLLAVALAGSVQGKPPWMGKEEGEVKPNGG